MNVLIIGAAGRTGAAVTEQALAAGHSVTAFVHHEENYTAPANVATFQGDVLDPNSLTLGMQQQEAVLDCLGGHLPWKTTSLETSGARNVLAAMRANNLRRLVILSTIGEGDSIANVHPWYEHLFMNTVLRGVMKDKAGMEDVVSHSDLDWVIVRPAGLSDGEPKGVSIVTPESHQKVRFITRNDVAIFMVQQLTGDQYLRQAIGIANL